MFKFSSLHRLSEFHSSLLGRLNFACASSHGRSSFPSVAVAKSVAGCCTIALSEGCNPIAIWAVLCGHLKGVVSVLPGCNFSSLSVHCVGDWMQMKGSWLVRMELGGRLQVTALFDCIPLFVPHLS